MKDEYISKSEKDTEKVAQEFAQYLNAGDVVFLVGDLGAGKTTFVRAVARALGIQSRILSPTFSLIRTHPVSSHKKIKKLHHVDLYRVENADDTIEKILKEFQQENDGVVFIEWPKKSNSEKVDWMIKIVQNEDGDREIKFEKL